jgi:KDO2-lipid IV(A) lauroyltransferase
MLYGFARCVAIMPRFVRYYILEEIIYFILQYVVRYRRKVVLTNLRNAFPEKSDKEISKIAARCNRNLAEQMINTLSVAGISPERLKRYQTVVNIEEYRKAVAGRDVILLAGHYGSWEYHTSVAQHAPEQMIMSIYHPLNNSVMDEFFKRVRKMDNTVLVPRDESLRYFLKNRGGEKNIAMGLIADQNPYQYKDSHWFTFLNQDTIFAEGGEQLARKFKLPVWFAASRFRRRGEYECVMIELYDGNSPIEEHVITERYIRELEKCIVERPELWLWSHRRWKAKKEK